MPSVEELARTGLDEFNRGDFEALRAEMGPGFVYEEAGTGRRITDPDEAITAFQQWRAAMPDVKGTVTRLIVAGDTVAMEIVWRGTHSGTLVTPTGDIPATGRGVQIWGTMWQEWNDGKVVAQRNHLDMLSLLAQIGAIPIPA